MTAILKNHQFTVHAMDNQCSWVDFKPSNQSINQPTNQQISQPITWSITVPYNCKPVLLSW